MNVIHMKKPGVYKRPSRALEPGKPFRMRDPKTYEWATFIPVRVIPTTGVCSQCAFCLNNGYSCDIRWEPKFREDDPMFIQFVGLCTRYIKGVSYMRIINPYCLVVFKRADDLLEDL